MLFGGLFQMENAPEQVNGFCEVMKSIAALTESFLIGNISFPALYKPVVGAWESLIYHYIQR